MKTKFLLPLICISTLSFLYSCTKTSSGTLPGWSSLGGTTGSLNANGAISTMAIDKAGNIYVTGSFTDANGYHYVAKWDGKTWSELGSLNLTDQIYSIATDAFGNIYIAGGVRDSTYRYCVAKWDGSSWNELGGNCYNNPVYVTTDASGTVYVVRSFPGPTSEGHNGLAKWNGTAWTEVGIGLEINKTYTMTLDVSGNLYIAGAIGFNGASYYDIVIRWDGSKWTLLNYGEFAPNGANALTTDPSGNLYAADFQNINGKQNVTKWDGSNWSLLDNGSANPFNANGNIDALVRDASGNIYAAGAFTNALGNNYIAKWDGKNWSELKYSINHSALNANGEIMCLAVDASGNIYAAGAFTDNHGYAYVAKFTK